MRGRHIVFGAIVAASILYFFFEAEGVLFAPSLTIFEPHNGAVMHTTRIRIAGKTDKGQRVIVSGQEFLADDHGDFQGMLTVGPGYREIGFSVEDRFANERRKAIKVFIE